MIHVESVALAARLLTVGAFVFLSVGFSCLSRMRVSMEWPEHLLYAFTISYAWIFGLSILLPAAGWTVDHAAVLTLVAVFTLLPWRGFPERLRSFRPGLDRTAVTGLCLAAAVVGFATSAWFIEPPIHGDAALDLLSVSRFADGGAIHFDNTSILPHTRATYLFQPYQLALGMMARWSGTDPIVAFLKIRPLLVLLSLTFVYAVVRRLVPDRGHAQTAFAVVLMFVGLDVTTWENNSLFPVVHRGGVAAGLCVPVLMVLILTAMRRADLHHELLKQRMATYLAPVFLIASICTHALEMYTLLCFAAAASLVVFSALDPSGDRRRTATLAGLLALVLAIYLPAHARALPEFTSFERDLKAQVTAEFNARYHDVPAMLVGPMGQEAGDLLGGRIPSTTAGIIGIPALIVAAFLAPSSAALLALATVPLALMFASPVGYLALARATSADSVQEATAYFGLLGLLGLSVGIAAGVHAIVVLGTRPRSVLLRTVTFTLLTGLAIVLSRIAQTAIVKPLLDFARSHPRSCVLVAAILTAAVVFIAARRKHRVVSAPPIVPAGVCLAAIVAMLLAGTAVVPEERVNLVAAVRNASAGPSVLEWNAYYDVLQKTILPRLPVPGEVVDELRRRVPPRQVVVANPRYSCSLAVVLDAYCINPEFIYGQYYLTARGYQDHYVHSIDGVDEDWHPFFNTTWPMEERERTFLQEYSVDYLLADPPHAALIDRKLRELNIRATPESSHNGYVLYTLGH